MGSLISQYTNFPISQFTFNMKIIKDLTTTKEDTLLYFYLPENDLIKTYGPGKWTVKEILNHIVDAETVLYERIRRTISKPEQVLWAFDQDAWCSGLDYKNFPLELNESIYVSVRNSIIYLAEKYYEKLGHHKFIHSATGVRALKDEFDKVAWHNAHHLEYIVKALGENPNNPMVKTTLGN